MNLGFITMAFGSTRYLRQAENMALSVRRHMPGIPLAIVTDVMEPCPLFDFNIRMKPTNQLGTVHKLTLYKYSPFRDSLFIDSDCIVVRPFHRSLRDIRTYEFTPVVSRYLVRGDQDLWLADVGTALDHVGGVSFPKFNGGVYFFKQGERASSIFACAERLRSRAQLLGIKDFDSAGPGDETLIGLALAHLKVSNLYDDHGELMRTPLNMTGKLDVDPLNGRCAFRKEGVMVSPAICHFCGEWVYSAQYREVEYSLRHGRPPSLSVRAVIRARQHIGRLKSTIKTRTIRLASMVPRLS